MTEMEERLMTLFLEAEAERDALRRALENILEATGYADAYGLAQEALTTLDERSK